MSNGVIGAYAAARTRHKDDAPGETTTRTAPAPAEFLKVPEAAEILRVNPHTLYDMVKRGQLPGVRRIGRVVRIHRQTLLRWAAEGDPGQGR